MFIIQNDPAEDQEIMDVLNESIEVLPDTLLNPHTAIYTAAKTMLLNENDKQFEHNCEKICSGIIKAGNNHLFVLNSKSWDYSAGQSVYDFITDTGTLKAFEKEENNFSILLDQASRQKTGLKRFDEKDIDTLVNLMNAIQIAGLPDILSILTAGPIKKLQTQDIWDDKKNIIFKSEIIMSFLETCLQDFTENESEKSKLRYEKIETENNQISSIITETDTSSINENGIYGSLNETLLMFENEDVEIHWKSGVELPSFCYFEKESQMWSEPEAYWVLGKDINQRCGRLKINDALMILAKQKNHQIRLQGINYRIYIHGNKKSVYYTVHPSGHIQSIFQNHDGDFCRQIFYCISNDVIKTSIRRFVSK